MIANFPIAYLDRRYRFSLYLFIILSIALTTRLVFFNGPFGSDDLVYLRRSLDVTYGEWASANYNGALRYGYNIPSGFILYLFGVNLFTANLWPLLCSLIEIALVFRFVWNGINHRTAIYSALFLALMPLHVAVSTRLHADPVVSMFLTSSFIAFFKAETTGNKLAYFLTGIALGCVFWVKELAVLTFSAFLLYPLIFRCWKFGWIYLVFGGLVMLLAHFALMTMIAGDPLHAFKTVIGQLNRSFIGGNQGEDSPWYYFYYLFFDIKHTWLIPVLALYGICATIKTIFSERSVSAVAYAAYWLVSLLLVLSFFPVSLAPLKFAMKQSNYLTLFLAPIAVFAGIAIQRLPRKLGHFLVFLALAGGIGLSFLEQQAYQVFTANSRALVAFAEQHPQRLVLGSVNNRNIACVYALLGGDTCDRLRINDFADITAELTSSNSEEAYAVIDRETLGWSSRDIKLDKAPNCWRDGTLLSPADSGNSRALLTLVLNSATFLPASLKNKLQSLQTPQPATLYRVDLNNLWCEG